MSNSASRTLERGSPSARGCEATISAAELANRWGDRVTAGTLRNWRCAARGPRWEKFRGRIYYSLVDVVTWEKANQFRLCARGRRGRARRAP